MNSLSSKGLSLTWGAACVGAGVTVVAIHVREFNLAQTWLELVRQGVWLLIGGAAFWNGIHRVNRVAGGNR